VQVECCLGVSLLAEFPFEVRCVFANDLEVVILETFGNLEVGVQTLFADFWVRVLNEVY
jgi:hypothetical protein